MGYDGVSHILLINKGNYLHIKLMANQSRTLDKQSQLKEPPQDISL